MLRRLILKRGLTALLGGAATLAAGRSVGSTPYYTDSNSLAPSVAVPTGEDTMRSTWVDIFYKQRRSIERAQHLRYRAYNEIDPDLTVLHSTSHAWKASVMYSRHKTRQSVVDEIQDRIDAIWQKPISYLQTVVASWIRGDA